MKFSIKDFFSNCDQIRSFLRIWLHLLKKSLMGNFIFSSVKQRFFNQAYKPELIKKHIKVAEQMGREELLKERDNTTSKETKIPLY